MSAREVRRQKHPGKFEGGDLIDEWLYNASMDGGPDEEVGDVGEVGEWYGLMHGGLLPAVFEAARDAGEVLTADEEAFILRHPAAIIFENDSGFVEVNWYESDAEAEKEFARIAVELEPEDEDDGD